MFDLQSRDAARAAVQNKLHLLQNLNEITLIQYIECNPTKKIKLLYIGIVYMIETASANRVHKASNYITMFDTVLLPYNKIYNNGKFLLIIFKADIIKK